MASGKYPWIPKEYYAAVRWACNMIRETGYFNKSVNTAANYYGLDPDVVAEHVKKRSAAGKRSSVKRQKRKFKYYIVEKRCYSCEGSTCSVVGVSVEKAMTAENAESKFSDLDFYNTMRNDTGGYYSLSYEHAVVGEFETRFEAEEALERHIEKHGQNYLLY